MLGQVKDLLKASPWYYLYQRWRYTIELGRWSGVDETRLEFYDQLIHRGDLVFDIGANMGNRTKVFLRLGARVIAFEPQSLCAQVLQRAFAGLSSFTLVQKAVGARAGHAELFEGGMHTLATMSPDWIRATRNSGRFPLQKWRRRTAVEVTTLDEAIRAFGAPRFSKIDVEGFETEVLSGLSQPICSGSLEFAAEDIDSGVWCLERLSLLGDYEFQFSFAEMMKFAWPQWLDFACACDALRSLAKTDRLAWGDIYFRSEIDSPSAIRDERRSALVCSPVTLPAPGKKAL